MDDLWGNAWGSPDDDAKATAWSTSEKPQNDDHQEDDLAMPSWSTGPGIQWDEPSDTQGPLWSNAHHTAQDWSLEHPYGDISLANSRPAEPPADDNSTVELPVEAESPPHSPYLPQGQCDDISAPSLSRELDEELSPSPISSPPPPEPSPPSSPDAFGTFTIGAEHSDTAPFSTVGGSLGSQIYDNEWGSPWGSVSKDVDGENTQFDSDEWESAKLRQLEMDSRVPPELLSRILLHLEEVTKDAWPESQDVAEEDWQKRWHSGMDVDGVLLLRYIPVLTLPQLLPSSRSFTAKAMADAVKLSRNTALARTSPMSTFLAAKGSTAWETSVKSRIEKTVDEVPLGWRILEKDPKKDEKAEDKVKKPTGLLAGLWGRRTPSSPSNPPGQEQSTSTPDATAPENAHPVPALDSPVTVTTPASPHPSPALASSQDDDAHLLTPGSAVSRFLKRFSRPRSSSPRNSLTLSGDDLEYLSDVRSDAKSNSTDLVDTFDGVGGLGGAAESTESGFLRGKLPPPLPPPPKVSVPPSHSPARGNTLNGHTLISPSDPHLNAIPDPQNPPEDPTISALTPLTPSPLNSSNPPSHPFSPDKIVPSLILPASSSRSNSIMSSQPVAQHQLQSASGYSTQPFDITQDDDDFSDFRSSPAAPSLLPLDVSSPVGQGKVVSTQSSQHQFNSPFDDLVHLMSSPTTGPGNTFEKPDAPRPFDFANPVSPMAPSPSTPREFAPTPRASLDRTDTTPTHSRTFSDSQQPTSPSKVVPTSPKQKAITQGHQRTQSLLDLAATRRGRWPAPPSPLPEPLQPPPGPPGKSQGEGAMNVDYFGTTPTESSFKLSPAPAPFGKIKTSVLPSPGPSSKDLGPAPNPFDTIARSPPRSPPRISAPHTSLSARRALSPPPLPAAIMNNSKSPSSKSSSSSSTPVPLLPPPGGFRLVAPAKAPPAPIAPESSPFALLMDSDAGKNISVPDVKATPPPPVKGTGGLSAQDLSFFEGL